MAGSSSRLVGTPRRIRSRNPIPDERLKFLVAHAAELIYMAALDLLHVDRMSSPRFTTAVMAALN